MTWFTDGDKGTDWFRSTNRGGLLPMRARRFAHVLALLASAGAACSGTSQPQVNGACVVDSTVDCTVDGQTGDSLALAGYACTGDARPDQGAVFLDGVPSGRVCASRGASDGGGTRYCCTQNQVSCAYEPLTICQDQGSYSYSCRGADRPEALNPAISCTQGVPSGDLIDYCCSGTPRTPCSAYGSCAAGLFGWTCPSGELPSAQDLGPNQSRADLYYMLCSIPSPAANPAYLNYCCFPPSPLPPGGSCRQALKVPGCQPGRYGMACYDRDRPDQDFPSLSCPAPGVAGVSDQGYAATLFCCDFKEQ